MRTRLPFLVAFGLLFAAPSWAANFVVTTSGVSFSPRNLSIHVGDTVTFKNGGGFHNVAADNGSFRCAAGCDGVGSGNGDPSNTAWAATVSFEDAGTVGYKCEVHAGMGMTGTITVEPATAPSFSMNQQGLTGSWANPATESQGVVMTVLPDLIAAGRGVLFGGWFTWGTNVADGPRWYTLQGDVTDDDNATMPIYLTTGGSFDTGQATSTVPVGQATMHFDDCTHGSLQYTFSDGSGRTGTVPLTRLLANVNCTSSGANSGGGSYLRSGAWADVSNSGQGLLMDFNPPQGVFFAAWYTYFADAAGDAGIAAQHWFTLQAAIPATFAALQDVGIFETTGGVFDQHATTATTPVGTATITWHTCSSATLDYAFTDGPNAGISGTLELTRLGSEPPGCTL